MQMPLMPAAASRRPRSLRRHALQCNNNCTREKKCIDSTALCSRWQHGATAAFMRTDPPQQCGVAKPQATGNTCTATHQHLGRGQDAPHARMLTAEFKAHSATPQAMTDALAPTKTKGYFAKATAKAELKVGNAADGVHCRRLLPLTTRVDRYSKQDRLAHAAAPVHVS